MYPSVGLPVPVDVLVVMPVGPNSNLNFMKDTIDSFIFYLDQKSSAMVVINDTKEDKILDFVPVGKNIIVYTPEITGLNRRRNTLGNSFVNRIQAIRYASEKFDWKCALRLDDDALITGFDPQLDALGVLELNARIGILGAYFYRGDGTNKEEAMAEKGRLLLRQLFSKRSFSNPRGFFHLSALLIRAIIKGYTIGHMCTGGAFFMSRNAYKGLSRLLPASLDNLRSFFLDDDLLFAIYAAACGFKFADFSREQDVMAINWRGLPMSPEQLLKLNKKVIHSVKDLTNPEREAEIRTFFRDRRSNRLNEENLRHKSAT